MDNNKRNDEHTGNDVDLLKKKIRYLVKLNDNLEKWNNELRARLNYLRYKGFRYHEGLEINTADYYKRIIKNRLIEILPQNTLKPVVNRLTDIVFLFMTRDEVEGKQIREMHKISKPTHARDMILIQRTGLVELKNGYRKSGIFVITQSGKEFQNEIMDRVKSELTSIRQPG